MGAEKKTRDRLGVLPALKLFLSLSIQFSYSLLSVLGHSLNLTVPLAVSDTFLSLSLAVDSEAETEGREHRRRPGRQGGKDRAERASEQEQGLSLGAGGEKACGGLGTSGRSQGWGSWERGGGVERDAELSLTAGPWVSLGVWVWLPCACPTPPPPASRSPPEGGEEPPGAGEAEAAAGRGGLRAAGADGRTAAAGGGAAGPAGPQGGGAAGRLGQVRGGPGGVHSTGAPPASVGGARRDPPAGTELGRAAHQPCTPTLSLSVPFCKMDTRVPSPPG